MHAETEQHQGVGSLEGKEFMKDLLRSDRLRIQTEDVIISATEMHYLSFIWMLISDTCNSMKVRKVLAI